jgi:ribosomal protein L7Ae-like RNA K-turn-binding protein
MDLEAEKKVVSLLQFAYRSGKLKFGFENLYKLKGKYFLILAKDLSENTKKDILKLNRFEIYFFKNKQELGKIFGKNNVGVVAVLEDNLGREIKRFLKG